MTNFPVDFMFVNLVSAVPATSCSDRQSMPRTMGLKDGYHWNRSGPWNCCVDAALVIFVTALLAPLCRTSPNDSFSFFFGRVFVFRMPPPSLPTCHVIMTAVLHCNAADNWCHRDRCVLDQPETAQHIRRDPQRITQQSTCMCTYKTTVPSPLVLLWV